MNKTNTCERAEDLVSVLYGEASESEQREFELHMQQCGDCRPEFAAFAQVRGAIGEWRDEALTGFVSSPVVTPARKSAATALRHFFDFSPLWMKGAVGFAAVLFCVLVVFAFGRFSSNRETTQVTAKNPQAVYTQDDLNRAVDDALAKQEALVRKQREQQLIEQPKPQFATGGSKSVVVASSAREPRARRPFSRAEREQLAAELRLISTDDSDLESPDR